LPSPYVFYPNYLHSSSRKFSEPFWIDWKARIVWRLLQRPGHKDMALLSAEELTGLLETVYLLRSPANARKLLAALERSMERDVQTIPGQTVTELCQELGIERQE
jgi:antitoxin YefM